MVLLPQAASAADWPGNSGTEIGSSLPSGYEPSGIVWHESLDKLFLVSDDGWISRMDSDGSDITTWYLSGDFEGITIADSTSDHLYIGVEQPDSIKEFDISTGSLTGKSWDLTPWMISSNNAGLEALTFVPNGYHPYADSSSGGLFYAGLQQDGKIYVFDVDLSTSESVTYVDTITVNESRTDISGLDYNSETNLLYIIFDSFNELVEMQPDETVVNTYVLPGNAQEGINVVPSCLSSTATVYIAQDSGEVWNYGSYPVDLVDYDCDGISDENETDIYGTDPGDSDTDGDGLPDGDEINTYGTTATSSDTDSDGFSDGLEVLCGSPATAIDSESSPSALRINFQPEETEVPADHVSSSDAAYTAPRAYGWR